MDQKPLWIAGTCWNRRRPFCKTLQQVIDAQRFLDEHTDQSDISKQARQT